MSESVTHKQRMLQEQVGDDAKVTVRRTKQGAVVYKISCRLGCTDPLSMSTFRSGQGNRYQDALDRWEKHLGWHRFNDAQSGSVQ